MTPNQHEMSDEQFERLLNLTGSQLSTPPMHNVVAATLTRIRSEQAAGQAADRTPRRWIGSSRERVLLRPPTSSYSSFGELPRSRWKDLGIFVGGAGAAAIVTLLLLLVFRGFGADSSSRDVDQGQFPLNTAAFSDPTLASSTLMVLAGDNPGMLLTNTVVLPVDPSTGEPVPDYAPIPGGGPRYAPAAITSEGEIYFASFESYGSVCEPMSGGSACRGSADVLHLVEATSWTDQTASLPGDSWVGGDAFSPDGRRYAVVLSSSTTHTLFLFDAATAELIAERELDFRPSLVSFALDGTALVVFGQQLGDAPGTDQPGPPRLQVLDAETLEPAWDHTFEGMLMGSWCVSECSGPHESRESVSWTPGVTVSPDGRTLVAVHADHGRLTRVDLSTGDVSDLELRVEAAWYDRLAGLFITSAEAKGETGGARRETIWAPDGSRLYVLTIDFQATRRLEDNTGVLQLIDPETGRILQERSVDAAATMSLSPDTADVLVGGMHATSAAGEASSWTTAFDAESLESIAELDGWQVKTLRTLDGRPILLAQRGGYESAELALMDAQSYAIVSSWTFGQGECLVTVQGPICQAR